MKRTKSMLLNKLVVAFFSLLLFSACVKDDQVFTVFKGEMVYTFLKRDTTYSEFIKVIDKSGLRGMLSAYGEYTCLAPTNDALRRYYSFKGPKFTFDSLSNRQIDSIARNHIIGKGFLTTELSEGSFPRQNMNSRTIDISFVFDAQTNATKVMLNDSSQVISRDNEVYNGVVYGISKVLQPSNRTVGDMLMKDTTMRIYGEALKLTHLGDSVLKHEDESYVASQEFKDEGGAYVIINPAKRRYGYTIFAVSDVVLKTKYNINSVADLVAYAKTVYPNPSYDQDYTNRNNSLNKFLSYHIVDKYIKYNRFFYTRQMMPGYTPDEYLQTLLQYRIIRASRVNSIPVLNYHTSYSSDVPSNSGTTANNGIYYSVGSMLVYTPEVETMLQNIRFRFDMTSLFPELTNNDIRGSEDFTNFNGGDRFGFQVGYLEGVSNMSPTTRLLYLAGKDNGQWGNFQSDEMMGLGKYDLTIRLLPVPPGNYELRFGYTANPNRSITQLYVDGKPVGIPLNLKVTMTDPEVGYVKDTETDDNGYENDKSMKNRGWMKAPTIFKAWGAEARQNNTVIRRVVGTFTFNDYGYHYIRFKSVEPESSKQCMIDYFELVPKSVYNPASGEPESRD